MCKAPLPGNTFVLFRTIKRADDSTIVTWLNEITDAKTDVDNLVNEWKTISPAESVHVATRWFTTTEQRLVELVTVTDKRYQFAV